MLYIAAFLISLLSVCWIHPRLVRIALDKNIVDNPNARKLQRKPLPVLAGIAVFFGSVIAPGGSSLCRYCSDWFIVFFRWMLSV